MIFLSRYSHCRLKYKIKHLLRPSPSDLRPSTSSKDRRDSTNFTNRQRQTADTGVIPRTVFLSRYSHHRLNNAKVIDNGAQPEIADGALCLAVYRISGRWTTSGSGDAGSFRWRGEYSRIRRRMVLIVASFCDFNLEIILIRATADYESNPVHEGFRFLSRHDSLSEK